jgi:phage terminase large subunit
MFLRTTAINKIGQLNKFIKGICGGSSAGKTYGIIPILVNYCAKEPLKEVSIVAESVPHLKRGAMKDFKKIMQETGRWNFGGWNATDFKYVFRNGSYIEFFSADDDSKLRGARRDILYMNEANNMSFHAFTELAMRTKESIYLDWNPVSEFWFDTELKNDDNVDFIVLTYKDNEAAPQAAIDFIERAKEKGKTSSYWENWYKVYGLGQVGSLEGVIFTNWKTIDTIPKDAEYLGNGLDFGYSNDPTAIVDFYDWNGQIIWHERAYQKGLLNSQIANILSQNNLITIAESAEPKSIAEIKLYGLKIIPTEKGPDSIQFGINLIQQRDFLVTKESLNLIKELRGYTWRTDKTGKSLNVPIDDFNHAIDAARYFYLWKFKPFKPRKAFGMS